jgi:hypothetical protein
MSEETNESQSLEGRPNEPTPLSAPPPEQPSESAASGEEAFPLPTMEAREFSEERASESRGDD